MTRQFHKPTGKLMRVVGIGGISCPCCTLGPKAITKHFWNKIQRQFFKRELNKELAFENQQPILDQEEWNRFFYDEEMI